MREHLNKTVKRKICVISPLRLVTKMLKKIFLKIALSVNPKDKGLGERKCIGKIYTLRDRLSSQPS